VCKTQKCLKRLAKDIVNGEVDLNAAFSQLNNAEQEIVLEEINILSDYATFMSRHLVNIKVLSPGYNVQMPYGGQYLSLVNNVRVSSYTASQTCDNDPTDWDWLFFANTSQTVSPSVMRWSADSRMGYSANQVISNFMAFYNGQLSTYGYSLYSINVCLGEWGVRAAGGPEAVRQTLRIKYR